MWCLTACSISDAFARGDTCRCTCSLNFASVIAMGGMRGSMPKRDDVRVDERLHLATNKLLERPQAVAVSVPRAHLHLTEGRRRTDEGQRLGPREHQVERREKLLELHRELGPQLLVAGVRPPPRGLASRRPCATRRAPPPARVGRAASESHLRGSRAPSMSSAEYAVRACFRFCAMP